MLHIRNTLHKHKYLENGTLSRLLIFTSDFTSRSPTVTTRNCRLHTEPAGAENHIISILFPSDLGRQTRNHINFMLHFLHQCLALLTGHYSDTLVLSPTQDTFE